MMKWHIQSFLPAQEPNLNNLNSYLNPNLISGSSEDARFVFDAVYLVEKQCFVLTMMEINDEWGFIEHEVRYYPLTRAQLLADIQRFQENPRAFWTV